MTTKFSPWSKDTSTRFPTDDVGGWNRDVFDPMGYLNSVGDALPLDFPVSNRTNQLMHRTQNEISKFSPILAADFFETDADYHVHLDLPGVKKDDLEVTLSNNELTIRAERKHCSEMETSHFRRRERTLGRVQRIVPVPANSNPELAQVDFVNGCLEVSPPTTTATTTTLLMHKYI